MSNFTVTYVPLPQIKQCRSNTRKRQNTNTGGAIPIKFSRPNLLKTKHKAYG